LVLSRGERLVGFVSYGPTQDDGLDPAKVGEIYLLYVAPEEWRKGHGRALLDEAVTRLQQAGRQEVVLWVLHNNEQAMRFYEAIGFATDGAQQLKRRPDGTSMIVIRYRRRLAPKDDLAAAGHEKRRAADHLYCKGGIGDESMV